MFTYRTWPSALTRLEVSTSCSDSREGTWILYCAPTFADSSGVGLTRSTHVGLSGVLVISSCTSLRHGLQCGVAVRGRPLAYRKPGTGAFPPSQSPVSAAAYLHRRPRIFISVGLTLLFQ